MAYKTEEEKRYREWLDQKHKADQAEAVNKLGEIIGEREPHPGEFHKSLLPEEPREPVERPEAAGLGRLPPELERQVDHELLLALVYDLKKNPEELRANYRKAIGDQDRLRAEKEKQALEEAKKTLEKNSSRLEDLVKKHFVAIRSDRKSVVNWAFKCEECGSEIRLDGDRLKRIIQTFAPVSEATDTELLNLFARSVESITFTAICRKMLKSTAYAGSTVLKKVPCSACYEYRFIRTK